MAGKEIKLKMRDNKEIYLYRWEPEEGTSIKGIVQVIHGMAEHGNRYERFAKALNKEGFIVYADDHRGHGKSAESIAALGYIADNDGFHTMVDDQQEINQYIRRENPDHSVFIFGHSMGSFISQRYMQLYGNTVEGVILSGTGGKPNLMMKAGIPLSGIIMKFKGRRGNGKLMNDLGFGAYNKQIPNCKTEFDWLSRDEEEVSKYVLDPYCGGIFPVSFYYDFLRGMCAIHKKENLNKIPKDLPVEIFSGDGDPVGAYGKGIVYLYNVLKELGVKNLNYKLYPGGRHELLNETNRDEVTKDLIEVLNRWALKAHDIETKVEVKS